MRERNSSARRVYEKKDATVIVRPPLCGILDGLIRADFYAEVHPADGGEVRKYPKLRAFFTWEAADIAVNKYRASTK